MLRERGVFCSDGVCTQVYTGIHRYTQVYTSIHSCTQVYTGIHRYTQFTGKILDAAKFLQITEHPINHCSTVTAKFAKCF